MQNENLQGSKEKPLSAKRAVISVGITILLVIGAILVIERLSDDSERLDDLRPTPTDVADSSVRREGSARKRKSLLPSTPKEKVAPVADSDMNALELERRSIERFVATRSLSFRGRDDDLLLSVEETRERGFPPRSPYPVDTTPSRRPHFSLMTVRGYRYADGQPRPTDATVDEDIPLITLWTLDGRELPNPVEVVKRDLKSISSGPTIEKYRAAHVVAMTWYRILDIQELEGTTIRVQAFWRGMTRTLRIVCVQREIKLQYALWDQKRPNAFQLMLEVDGCVAFQGIQRWRVTVRDAGGRPIKVEPINDSNRRTYKTEEGVRYWRETVGTYDFDLELIDPGDVEFPLEVRLDIEDPFGVKKSTTGKLYAPIR